MKDFDWSSMALLEEQAAPVWYTLPSGWTWARVAESRHIYDIASRMLPLASAGGAVAWGRPLAQEYKAT